MMAQDYERLAKLRTQIGAYTQARDLAEADFHNNLRIELDLALDSAHSDARALEAEIVRDTIIEALGGVP